MKNLAPRKIARKKFNEYITERTLMKEVKNSAATLSDVRFLRMIKMNTQENVIPDRLFLEAVAEIKKVTDIDNPY